MCELLGVPVNFTRSLLRSTSVFLSHSRRIAYETAATSLFGAKEQLYRFVATNHAAQAAAYVRKSNQRSRGKVHKHGASLLPKIPDGSGAPRWTPSSSSS